MKKSRIITNVLEINEIFNFSPLKLQSSSTSIFVSEFLLHVQSFFLFFYSFFPPPTSSFPNIFIFIKLYFIRWTSLFVLCYLKSICYDPRKKTERIRFRSFLSSTKYQISFWKLLFLPMFHSNYFYAAEIISRLLTQAEFQFRHVFSSFFGTWLFLTVSDGRREAFKSDARNWWKLKVVWFQWFFCLFYNNFRSSAAIHALFSGEKSIFSGTEISKALSIRVTLHDIFFIFGSFKKKKLRENSLGCETETTEFDRKNVNWIFILNHPVQILKMGRKKY